MTSSPTEDTPTCTCNDESYSDFKCPVHNKQDDRQLREAIAEIVHYLTDDSDLLSSGIRGTIDRLEALFTTAQHNCNAIPDDQPNDVHIKYFNEGFRAGQLQLVSELEGELPTYLTEEAAEELFKKHPQPEKSDFYHYALGQVKIVLEHKKQELEGKI